MKLSTKLIHAGIEPDPSTGAIMTPIYQTSTYVQSAPGKHKGYEYARSQNPTRKVLETAMAHIENGRHGLCFASGVAATDAVLRLLSPGDEVIAANDMYGGTYRLFTKIFEKSGIRFHFVDMQDTAHISSQINAQTKLIWLETPTNPLMNIVDIAAVAAIAGSPSSSPSRSPAQKILVCVDNTFASPYLQNPLDLGADIVLHSATKYLGGHSDTIHGALVMNDDELREKLYFIQKSCGAVPGPQDCFLVLRGLKTLHVRMDRHCTNGEAIARYLRQHPKVGKVYWCGFEDHPGYAIAKKQMRGFGGMMSFTLKDDSLPTAIKLLSSTKLFALAESLGGVESLINHPASMTHASIPREERIRNGLSDSLIRLSVGLEDAGDLIEDLEQAIG
ncbi:MAG: PLP-dependent aspartate aminotransferase family protein [Bacteroidota bacterium]|nr:PLP-dependent aspartate aminotransferase family protein [Bacteroidota bacterium]MDP4247884.1 PLP-dependent aspartate aminotransferase family protein [Bacteroidota bacterium]MDP4253611.1 PLP-dependent aspartate aminotransferase family protein [Bacteroidota bacterium]MDP4258287.1 PLP-dependent aspartate aminotransferase family protein [Bacteroidota bacterium]